MGQVYGYVCCKNCDLSSTTVRFRSTYNNGAVNCVVSNGQYTGYLAPGCYRIWVWCGKRGRWVRAAKEIECVTSSPEMINVVSSCSGA